MLSSDLSVLDWQRCIGRVSVSDFVKVIISSPPLAKMLYRGNIALFKGVCSARPQLDVPSCLASSNCSGQSFFKPGASCWFIPSLRRSRRNAHSLRISTIRHRRLNPKRSLCQSQLADIAEFKPAPPITGPGECTAIDPVNVEAVLLPANQRVAFTPMVTLQCSMALAVARWIRGDVVPTLDKFGLALRGVETLEFVRVPHF